MEKTKTKKTHKQRAKTFGKVLLSIVLVIVIIAGIFAILNSVTVKGDTDFVENSVEAVSYSEQLEPTQDDNGFYTFVTDDDFKLLQLTDIHIGGGVLSAKKDSMALNAVAAMVSAEKPDLVVVTGDITYPVPFSAGTFNNKESAKLFASLMEKLGVYWCFGFGNHDTEAYSYFSREQIAAVYEDREKYPHCLFQSGPEDVDGVGNYVINIKNTEGKITQSLFVFDSHSYTDNDYLGIMWKYDCIHKNQIDWYKNTLAKLTEDNKNEVPKSLAFYHIPLIETKEAYDEWAAADFKDTENIKYIYGKAGEHKKIVYSSEHNEGMFDAFLSSGSTQGVFFGHDHLNNFSLIYKGIRMTYGYSVDYLAYSGIHKFGAQRGCTVIDIKTDGSYDVTPENYYQDKYQSINEKETVDMGEFYSE